MLLTAPLNPWRAGGCLSPFFGIEAQPWLPIQGNPQALDGVIPVELCADSPQSALIQLSRRSSSP